MFEKLFLIRRFLFKVLFVILTSVLATTCVGDYINGSDQEKVDNLKQMIDEQTTVTAELSDHYEVTKVLKTVTLYKFSYSFNLYGKDYNGKITTRGLPNTNKLTLYYLSSDPSIVSADPFEDLKAEEKKGSVIDLLFGLLWAVLAILFSISAINIFKRERSDESAEVESMASSKVKIGVEEPVESAREEKNAEPDIDKEDPSRFMPH